MDVRDILAQKNFAEPPEVAAIKKYVAAQYNGHDVGVTVQNDSIVLHVDSSAFAASLRTRTLAIQRAAQTTKRLVFRIM